jgi:hypothetical protein
MEFVEHGLRGFNDCEMLLWHRSGSVIWRKVLEFGGESCYQFLWVSVFFFCLFFLLSLLLNATRRVFFIACIHAKNELRVAIDISFDGGEV